MEEKIEIDGSILEGGGQILRNCVSLSAILGKPIHIENIRKSRPKTGLRPQHLCGIELISRLYGGQLVNGHVNSEEITFNGGFDFNKGTFTADIQTAGSVCLLIQIVLPCLLFGRPNTKIILKGGTNATMAPQIDYFSLVFTPIASQFGIDSELILIKRGYYPVGKGEATLSCKPVNRLLPIMMLEQGQILKIDIFSFVSGKLHVNTAKHASSVALNILQKKFPKVVFNNQYIKDENSVGTGNGIIIVATTDTGCKIAGSSLGTPKIGPEIYAKDAAEQLVKNIESGGAVDEFLQDQLIIFMALADGVSKILTGPLELHTTTSIHFAQIMTGAKFTVEELKNKTNIITCEGIGYQNRYL